MCVASLTAATRQASVTESSIALPPASVESRHVVSHVLNPPPSNAPASIGQRAGPNMPLLRRHHAAPPDDPKTWSAFGTVHLRLPFLRTGRNKGSSYERGMRPPHYGGRLTFQNTLYRSGPRKHRSVDAYVFCELLTKRDLIRRIRWQRRTESFTLQRTGDFVDLAQDSSQDDLSLQQASGSRAPPLNASTA
jgi:hypothetical protein